MTAGGLLHSDICGSIPACGSPQLFAAYRVLRRLPMPRHPPCALISLTFQKLEIRNQRLDFSLAVLGCYRFALLFSPAPVNVSFANSRIMLLSLEVCLKQNCSFLP